MIGRRGFLGVLAGAIAAPIVVRSGLLMPIRSLLSAGPWFVPGVEESFDNWLARTVAQTFGVSPAYVGEVLTTRARWVDA